MMLCCWLGVAWPPLRQAQDKRGSDRVPRISEVKKDAFQVQRASNSVEEAHEHDGARYRERLLPELEDRRPYPYPFKRLLLWGRRGGG